VAREGELFSYYGPKEAVATYNADILVPANTRSLLGQHYFPWAASGCKFSLLIQRSGE